VSTGSGSPPSPSEALPVETAEFDELRRTNLREEATRVIRARIVSGGLKPGTLYAIGPIARALGVSVTPVREALLDLANEELVEIVRNRGFRVTTLDNHDLDELVDVRTMLEVPAMGRLAALQPRPDLSELRGLAHHIETCAARGDLVEFLAHDRDLHLRLLAMLGNRRLVQIVGRLRDQTRLYGLLRLAGSERLLESAREHDQLLSAIEAGDEEGAGRLMTQHLRHTRGLWAGREETAAAQDDAG
jgi:DNA-binding GntR family transcriptional regulator